MSKSDFCPQHGYPLPCAKCGYKKPFSFIANSANPQTPSQTLRVLTYEIGKVNEHFHRAEVYPSERNLYMGDMKGEVADSVSMLRMFCEHYGWNFEEIMKLGEERYLEKQEDLRRYGLQAMVERRSDE